MGETEGQIFGNRYQLLEKLGQGGMGAVYRATDRLNRNSVALKVVSAAAVDATPSTGVTVSTRMVLAHEFQILASLQHPHVINVLDYGFDARKQPYFTMSLLESPQTITQAGRDKSLTEKFRLITQMLQALAYLHRRGIIHRDLKPDNALVNERGEVKVLDFGLAVLKEKKDDSDEIAGTFAYIAPELLQGASPSNASDMYAVGVIAFELLSGHHPFRMKNPTQLIQDILFTPPDVSVLDVNDDVINIIERLLSKDPETRYSDAYQIIDDLIDAVGDNIIPQETAEIRESFLQAAQFVGRDNEIGQLVQALIKAGESMGSAWLIGGESGVGKSRLIDEIRTRALVQGALVLHGQEITGGALSYQPWREPLRRLILSIEVSDLDAGILKQIMPDIQLLLERDIPNAPELEGETGQQRLLQTIVSLFTKHDNLILLILEDLQWSVESLDILKALIPLTISNKLLIIGNYRNDERPGLPDELPGMNSIILDRLSDAGITELSVSMLGEAGKQPDVLDLLKRESEGNVFFLVEIVRALAEDAGSLSEVGRRTLPSQIFAGGVQQVIQRRLRRVPDYARSLLNYAAITGRHLDIKVLKSIDPDMNFEEWLTVCSNAAVLEIQDENWRFAHDKLREGLVRNLDKDTYSKHHKDIATHYQKIYEDSVDEYAAIIATHYEEAAEIAEAANWYAKAGNHDRIGFAPIMAIKYYEKALGFWEQTVKQTTDVQLIKERLKVYDGLGSMLNWQARYAEAVDIFTRMIEMAIDIKDEKAQIRAIMGMAMARMNQGDLRTAIEDLEKAEHIARKANTEQELTQALWRRGWAMLRMGDIETTRQLGKQALELSQKTAKRDDIAQSSTLLGAVHYTLGQYNKASEDFETALATLQELGERGPAMALMNNLGVLAAARGDYETAFKRYYEALEVANQIGNREAELVYRTNLGGVLAGSGKFAEAADELLQIIDSLEAAGLGEISEAYRFLAESYIGQFRLDDALEAAQRALNFGTQLESMEYIAGAWRVLGRVASFEEKPIPVNDQSYTPKTCFEESIRIYTEAGMEGERARALRDWAIFEIQEGDRETGLKMWAEAKETFSRLGANFEVERMPDLA